MTECEINMSEICRCCKSIAAGMTSIFDCDEMDESIRVDKMLMTIASLNIRRSDGLPSLICTTCIQKAQDAYAFRQQLIDIEADLWKILESQRKQLPTTQTIKDETNDDLIELEFNNNEHDERNNNQHKRRMHSCTLCPLKFARLCHIKRHLFSHLKNKSFACNKCSRKFNRSDTLRRHARLCDGNIKYSCDVCNKGFRTEGKLDGHKHRALHSYDNSPLVKTLNLRDLNDSNIHEHYTIDHDADSDDDNDDNDDDNDEKDKIIIKTEREDENIKRIKIEEKEFICPVCNESFERITLLEEHGKEFHVGYQVLTCSLCDATFSRLCAMNRHMRFHNNNQNEFLKGGYSHPNTDGVGEKTYLCLVCDREFSRASNLTVHMRTHPDENNKLINANETEELLVLKIEKEETDIFYGC